MIAQPLVARYDAATIDTLEWPDTPDGRYARSVLAPMVRHGPAHLIANAQAEVQVLRVGDALLPLVLANAAASPQSYVCSPTVHYIDYACREVELELGGRPLARAVFPSLLRLLRIPLGWAQFEQVVYVNNWLLSTNLYPALPLDALPAVRDALAAAFPDRAIVFRSVSDMLGEPLRGRLARLGFRGVFSRQVYLLDPRDGGYARKKSFQKDRSLARRSPYQWGAAQQIAPHEIGRVKHLYDSLYIDKYSAFNPQFTEQFFAEALREGWLMLMAARRDGRVDGVLGFVERNGVMTTPLIGYDRSLPAEDGLYRLISLKLVEEAAARGLVLHQSSGAAAFKRHRGSLPSVEYNMVYDRHLPPARRAPWAALATLTSTLIVPLMRLYGL
ncbi:GNAT family N-acetyltransferase [Chloroflexia bacterium SDU3-3]|nr:GNAT family N-acetyltransferase [Chloroflexia bacterium SDU3-3]